MEKEKRPKVLIIRRICPDYCLDDLRNQCDLIYCDEKIASKREEIIRKIKGVNGVLWCTTEKLDSEILDAAGPQLQVVSTTSGGYDRVDCLELKKRNIQLGHAPRVADNPVADQAIGLMIAAARRHYEGRRFIERNEWKRGQYVLGRDIVGSTVGIVGFGRIGQTIAKRLQGFDIDKILYTGHNKKAPEIELNYEFVTFEEILKNSDIIFISAPLTEETRGIFDLNAFKKMKKRPILINVARGAIVDTDALVIALSEGLIFAAGLDVMYPEPLPMDHILLKFENCIITPHSGCSTTNTHENMIKLAAENIVNVLSGNDMLAPVLNCFERGF